LGNGVLGGQKQQEQQGAGNRWVSHAMGVPV